MRKKGQTKINSQLVRCTVWRTGGVLVLIIQKLKLSLALYITIGVKTDSAVRVLDSVFCLIVSAMDSQTPTRSVCLSVCQISMINDI